MAEPDAKQIYTNALPLIAVVMMASGIIVKSVPLESRRPVDPERVAFVPAGRQDVDARLWQDPFTAIRGIKDADSLEQRCKKATEDSVHGRRALYEAIAARTRNEHAISVLAVMVPGGAYFEDGEARRRSRYAVVSALLHTDWEPASEDKLGYVWTLESCIPAPSERRAPELLPYEWFRFNANGEGGTGKAEAIRRDLLVLWVNEDAVERRPLRGIERMVELLAVPCPSIPKSAVRTAGAGSPACDDKPLEAKNCDRMEGAAPRSVAFAAGQGRPLPWCDTRVVGPATSASLQRLVYELAQSSRSATPEDWLRFYSSGATAYLDDPSFKRAIDDAGRAKSRKDKTDRPMDIDGLRKLFAARVVRLTASDDKLITAFADELRLRLVDATPFSRIRNLFRNRSPFCASTVVLVSEGDTSYAREFQKRFASGSFQCLTESPPRVVSMSYLRGLDGVLPVGAGAPVPAVPGPQSRAPDARDTLLDPVTLERADGRSQYDYLRRLAQRLGDIDLEEKRAGRNGIRAVGIVGNDAYDKLLVLDALRDRFPSAVFFTPDLDARLIGGGARSTRNLVVASAYGLLLNPGIQGTAPPFRDTYQTGTYLATRVALDASTAELTTKEFDIWFDKPPRFEIGRTRAVPLSPGAPGECRGQNLAERLKLKECGNIQALDEWLGATPFPGLTVTLALAAMLATAGTLTLLLSHGARKVAARMLEWSARRTVLNALLILLALMLFVGGPGYLIWNDATSGGGEPFAWFEGVSIWPTQIFRLGILALTFGLLAFGRWQLLLRIDRVAEDFGLVTLTTRKASPPTPLHGWKENFLWICSAGKKGEDEGERGRADDSPEPSQPESWIEYLDRLRFRPSVVRIAVTSALFFVFSVALTSLDWPHSPHRGELAAWFNHVLLLLLLGAMTALLFAALDASGNATRLLTRLSPGVALPRERRADEKKLRRQYPVGDRAIEAWIRFRLAVRVASEVNWFIYFPFLTLLLIIPTQSRIFDDWNLPLPFAALLAISITLAALCARRLRLAAGRLKGEVLDAIQAEVQNCKLGLPAGQAATKSKESPMAGSGPQEVPREFRVELLERIADHIRGVRDGPFRPLSQEPAVRAILLLLGGAGGISTAEFLFVSRG